MLTVSEKWAPSLTASRTVAHRVEVWRGYDLLVPDLPVSSGTVVRDFGADITLSASVEVADPSYLPVVADDPLMPLGSELRVHLGMRYAGGQEELVEVFRGPIVSCPTWPTTTYGFTVRAEGWMRYVADNRFPAPYAPSASVAVKTRTAVADLLVGSMPPGENGYSIWQTGLADPWVPADFTVEEDRLEAVRLLAASVGAVTREQLGGGFITAKDPEPNPGAVPVRSYVYGEDNTMLDRSEPELTREERYNAVVSFNPEDDTVRALATVDDPASPVRWGGPFGNKVLFHSSPLLTAATVAQDAATRLANLKGRVRQITAEIAPDYSLEPGDHVLIRWPRNYRAKAQIEEVAMVRRVEHTIGPGTTKLELRGTA